MVAVEGAEGAEHGPAGAELLGGGVAEAADVGADDGHLEDAREVEHGADGPAVVRPVGEVVAQPVADGGAGAGEGGARDDHGPQGGAARGHGVPREDGHHGAVDGVGVVLGEAVVVDQVGVDGVVGNAAVVGVPGVGVGGFVVDGVLGEEEVAVGEAELLAGGLPGVEGGDRGDDIGGC